MNSEAENVPSNSVAPPHPPAGGCTVVAATRGPTIPTWRQTESQGAVTQQVAVETEHVTGFISAKPFMC